MNHISRALRAAQQPPDPVAELREASKALQREGEAGGRDGPTIITFDYDSWKRLEEAIAAVEAMKS